MAEKTQEQEIADGQRVAQLLNDPAIHAEIAGLDARYWNEAKASKSDTEILAAVAKARALGDLRTRMDAVVQNGKIANATRERTNRR